MADTHMLREVRIRNNAPKGLPPEYWVIFHTVGSDNTIMEVTCCERYRPFAKYNDAESAARFVASHYINDDRSAVRVVNEETGETVWPPSE